MAGSKREQNTLLFQKTAYIETNKQSKIFVYPASYTGELSEAIVVEFSHSLFVWLCRISWLCTQMHYGTKAGYYLKTAIHAATEHNTVSQDSKVLRFDTQTYLMKNKSS